MSVNVRIRNGLEPDEYSDGGATEGDVRGDQTDLIDTVGVVDVTGGHLLVHQDSPVSMDAIVDEGVGYIPNDSFDEFDSDSIKFWEAVVGGTEASRTLTISSNSSGQTRIDLICLYLDSGATPDNTASNIAELVVVEGTPGAGAPSLPAFHLKLAEVTVVNGATEIENADIADSREQCTVKAPFLAITVNRGFSWYIPGTFLTGDEQGMKYIVPQNMTAVKAWFQTESGSCTFRLQKNTSNIVNSVTADTNMDSSVISVALTAGDVLTLDIQTIGAGVGLRVELECEQ